MADINVQDIKDLRKAQLKLKLTDEVVSLLVFKSMYSKDEYLEDFRDTNEIVYVLLYLIFAF